MRTPFALWCLAGVLALGACSTADTVAPTVAPDVEVIDLVSDYDLSAAATIDGAGIGASLFPDSLALTAEQKAAIQVLHDAFRAGSANDLAALRAIEKEVRDALHVGKSRDDIHAILRKALPAQMRLTIAFVKLTADIWNVYTPAQKAWLALHRPRICGPDGAAKLTEAQAARIRVLRESFARAVHDDVAIVLSVVKDAEAARQAGKSAFEIRAILARANAAHERIRAAERKLQADIDAVLTAEQRAAHCLQIGPRPSIQGHVG